jgi:hypothetical protein
MVPGIRIWTVVGEEKVLDSRRPHGSSDWGKFIPISGIDVVVDENTVDCLWDILDKSFGEDAA